MKKLIIWLIVIGIFLAAAIFGYGIYKSYIKPYLTSMKYSTETLKEEATDNKAIIEDLTGLKLRELTDEEKLAIEKGEMSESEIMEQIIKEASKNIPVKKGNPDAIAAKYLSEIYALQSKYTAIIEGVIPEVRAYYLDLRKNKKYKKEEAVISTTKIYMPKIEGYESECDSKVKDVLSRLEKELKKNNCDTEIIGRIKSSYEKEKEKKSAYYMKLLLGK